jgi:hypothetical protein
VGPPAPFSVVIASDSEAIQTQRPPQSPSLDCFALLAMTSEKIRLQRIMPQGKETRRSFTFDMRAANACNSEALRQVTAGAASVCCAPADLPRRRPHGGQDFRSRNAVKGARYARRLWRLSTIDSLKTSEVACCREVDGLTCGGEGRSGSGRGSRALIEDREIVQFVSRSRSAPKSGARVRRAAKASF